MRAALEWVQAFPHPVQDAQPRDVEPKLPEKVFKLRKNCANVRTKPQTRGIMALPLS